MTLDTEIFIGHQGGTLWPFALAATELGQRQEVQCDGWRCNLMGI
jgi:hypothetical protein